jgi:hypothetical protein
MRALYGGFGAAAGGMVGVIGTGLTGLLINVMDHNSNVPFGVHVAAMGVGALAGAALAQGAANNSWHASQVADTDQQQGGRSTLQFARDTIWDFDHRGDGNGDGAVMVDKPFTSGKQQWTSGETLDKWSSQYGWREYRHSFAKMDVDGDHQVTDQEFARYASMWDANRDGRMSPEEQNTFRTEGFTYGPQFS